MESQIKHAIVIGAGKSGIAASNLLLANGVQVVLYDGNKDADKAAIQAQTKAKLVLGDIEQIELAQYDTAVFSPGVPLDCPDAQKIKAAGLAVIGEIELGYRYGKGRIAAITGTNGKTTTTALTGELLRGAFSDVRVVGNIGEPYTAHVADTTDDTVIVAEISSFQLETTDRFAPEAAAILNITPDHLNRHHTMEAYIEAKERIATHARTIVLNYEDETLRTFGGQLAQEQNILWFSSARELPRGLYTKDGVIRFADGEQVTDILPVDELQIIGRHNHENAMAAIALALAFGAELDAIRAGLKRFVAVAHRIEFAGEYAGVRYYDDSKATNTDAAIKGIQAMPSATYLIGGGYDKGSTFHDWIRAFDGKVKKLLLIGATKEKIAHDAEECGFLDYLFFETMQEAFDYAQAHAQAGENVLLSPACASWDMFRSYEQRGDLFKDMVKEIGAAQV